MPTTTWAEFAELRLALEREAARGALAPEVRHAQATLAAAIASVPDADTEHLARIFRAIVPSAAATTGSIFAAAIVARELILRRWRPALPDVCTLLVAPDSDAIREDLITTIRSWRVPELIGPALAQVLTMSEYKYLWSRAKAAEALGEQGDAAFAHALVATLDDSSPDVRTAAVRALAQLAAGVDSLLARFDVETDPYVTSEIAEALADLEAKPATPRLTARLSTLANRATLSQAEEDEREALKDALMRLSMK